MKRERFCRGRAAFGAATLLLLFCINTAHAADAGRRGTPWPRHTIDGTSRGADGVRLSDVNGDELPDVTTGWEEGGVTRVYLHPGAAKVSEPWPAVTVGPTRSVEDAVLVDLDADGRADVVSSCEGRERTMFVHWAPSADRDYLDPAAWKTEPIAASAGRMMWMFAVPMQVDGAGGVDLVGGAKGEGAQIGWFESPENPRDLDAWKWHPIGEAGWIMSLRTVDVDDDGDLDVLTTDRKGPLRGCRWLENPGAESNRSAAGPWRNHFIGGRDHEVMFMTPADLDGDGSDELLMATRDNGILWFRRGREAADAWQPFSIRLPDNVGTGKGVGVGDVDRDGRADVVFTCENASGSKSGVLWLSCSGAPTDEVWTPHEISGPEGIKFDRIELLDLDGDGDLDVMTCEEREPVGDGRQGLGVFWYENRP
jgi:hypothetical protein